MSDDTGSAARSYRPGQWFGIFGERATVILPPSEKARVAALWELLDDGAGFAEALDAVIATGLRELPGFVLVSESDGETKVVLRGAARATFTVGSETVELEGSAATTWVERSLRDVSRMVVEVAEETDAVDLTIGVGLVRISRLDQPPYVGEVVDAPVLPADDRAGADDAPVDEMSSITEATGVEEPAAEPADGWATEQLAVPARPVDLAPVGDHDGLTHAGARRPDEHDPVPPGIPGQPPAPGFIPRPIAVLSFSSGERVDVDRAVLVGRAPEARHLSATAKPRLITVPSPHQEISSTHLEIRPGSGADHGAAVVADLGSTNGTVLVQPGLPPEDLQPGMVVQLIPGAILDLGDGVTIQVTNP